MNAISKYSDRKFDAAKVELESAFQLAKQASELEPRLNVGIEYRYYVGDVAWGLYLAYRQKNPNAASVDAPTRKAVDTAIELLDTVVKNKSALGKNDFYSLCEDRLKQLKAIK
jgi:hypothetical protein